MNLVLIGYRGTGKSTVAKLLAGQLGMEVVSLDQEIVRHAGRAIPEIVAEHGWPHFRDLESAITKRVCERDNIIIDAGGGVILRPENVGHLRRNGTLFWLRASVPVIVARIEGGTERPALTAGKSFTEEVKDVLRERTPLYEAAAHHLIDSDALTPEQVAAGIVRLFTGRFRAQYGPWALVAGAAVGLGAEYARQIAAHGLHLVLLDRDPEPLRATAQEIRSRYDVQVRPVTVDLARSDLIEMLRPEIADLEIGLVVYNAAIGTVAPFLELQPAHCETMVDVNCRGPIRLAHALLPPMVSRGRGGLILMSSMSGNIGSTQLAIYAATKAFNLVFADALWAEMRPHGVDVLAVQPGSTRTPGWISSQRVGEEMFAMEPAEVVREALATLGVEPSFVAGEANRQGAAMLASLPRRQAIEWVSAITAKLVRNDRSPA